MKILYPFFIGFHLTLTALPTTAAEQLPSPDEMLDSLPLTQQNYTPIGEVHKKQYSPRMEPNIEDSYHNDFQPGPERFIMDIMFLAFILLHWDD